MPNEKVNIRQLASKLADSDSSADKLVAGYLNQYIQALGDNANVDGAQILLSGLFKAAYLAALKLESCRAN